LKEMKKRPAGSYDHNYIPDKSGDSLTRVARVREPDTGRIMTVHSTESAVQFYLGNVLNGQAGKNGATYEQHEAFCLKPSTIPMRSITRTSPRLSSSRAKRINRRRSFASPTAKRRGSDFRCTGGFVKT